MSASWVDSICYNSGNRKEQMIEYHLGFYVHWGDTDDLFAPPEATAS